jgi:hypothetical protein
MITFTNRFYGIINFDECIPDYSGWIPKCIEKTWGIVVYSLFWLILEILWYHAYGIIVAILVIATIRRNRRRDQRPERRNIEQDGEQMQSQHLATSVSFHTKGQRPIASMDRNGKNKHESSTPSSLIELQRPGERICSDVQNTSSYVVNRFIEGLLKRELKIQLSANKPNTLRAGLEIDTRYERVFLEFRTPCPIPIPTNLPQTEKNSPIATPNNDHNQSLPIERSNPSQQRKGHQSRLRLQSQLQQNNPYYNLRQRPLKRPLDMHNSLKPRPCMQCRSSDHVSPINGCLMNQTSIKFTMDTGFR